MHKKYEIIQEEISDCGISCLASIIKYYDGYVPLETLRLQTNTSYEGTNAYNLINCANKLGFYAYGERTNEIDIKNLPLIAHIKLDNDLYHFIVIYKIKNNYMLIMDPSVGFKKINMDTFYKLFTRVTINLKPITALPKYKQTKIINKKIYEHINNNKKILICIMFLCFINLILIMIINFQIKIIEIKKEYIYFMIIVIIINEVIEYIRQINILKITYKINKKLVNCFINFMFKLPLNYLKLKQKGELVTRFNEINELSNTFFNYFINISFNIILIISILIIFKIINIKIFLISLLFGIIYILINIKIYNKLKSIIFESVNKEECYISNIIDYINKFNSIKHLRNNKFFVNKINNNLKDKIIISRSITKTLLKIETTNDLIINIFLLVIIYVLIIYKYDITKTLIIFSMFNYFINLLKKINEYYPTHIFYKNILNKNNELFSIELENKEYINKLLKYDININNLSYKINNNIILNDFNFIIEENTKLYINGPSGVGKSTLLKIISGEIINYTGYIKIGDYDIKKYDLSDFISYTSQDEELFNDTIYNNLTLGKKIKIEELKKVISVCKLENIDIIKNYGMDFKIINSNCFSGGEINRLILARSLIHSKKILILDEVLKEVDYELEINIIKDLLKLYKDKTIIYVSHKDTSNLFDKVLTFRKE